MQKEFDQQILEVKSALAEEMRIQMNFVQSKILKEVMGNNSEKEEVENNSRCSKFKDIEYKI